MEIHFILLVVGSLLLLGFAADGLGRRTRLPQITLLILMGVAIGPAGLDLLPINVEQWYMLFADLALLLIGFLLGGRLSRRQLRKTGREVLSISVFEVLGAAIFVFLGLTLLGTPIELALILSGIAPASAPAAITVVVKDLKARGRFTDVLLGVVASDDAWGLIVFIIVMAIAQALHGGGGYWEALGTGSFDLGGSFLLGILLGAPAAYLTGRVRSGEPTLIEALGLVFLCGGIAHWLEVPFLLAAMTMGAVIANFAKHHRRPFHSIENIERPFIVMFFVLAGASMKLDALMEVGVLGAAYILLRTAGLVVGAWLGGTAVRSDPSHRRWMGLAITPQAGVALGMVLVASSRFPELQAQLLAIVISTTIVFELFGPLLTQLALYQVGEVGGNTKNHTVPKG